MHLAARRAQLPCDQMISECLRFAKCVPTVLSPTGGNPGFRFTTSLAMEAVRPSGDSEGAGGKSHTRKR